MNLGGEESLLDEQIHGYNDGFVVTAPVDELWVNPWGLAGVAGNVWEVTTSDTCANSFRYWFGGAWTTGRKDYFTNYIFASKMEINPNSRENKRRQKSHDGGFRLVISP